jgi:hypothetical protein
VRAISALPTKEAKSCLPISARQACRIALKSIAPVTRKEKPCRIGERVALFKI